MARPTPKAPGRRSLARSPARRQSSGRGRGAGAALAAHERSQAVRAETKTALESLTPRAKSPDADYVFITFILDHLPHGVIGLLVAAFFAAALSSKAAELNALGSTTTVDFYRHLVKRQATTRTTWPRQSGSPSSGAWSRSPSPCSPTWRRT